MDELHTLMSAAKAVVDRNKALSKEVATLRTSALKPTKIKADEKAVFDRKHGLLTPAETMRRLCISRTGLWRMVQKGELHPTYPCGPRSPRFTEREVESRIEQGFSACEVTA